LVRSLSWPGQLLYLDSTFREVGGKVHDLVFQPGELGLIDLQTKVSGILSTAFMAAGAINSNITINADGTLSGAGGGQVQIGQLPGSVAVGQLTANIVTALQVVAATLSAIRAELGTVVISTTGHLRSGQTAFDTGTGFWLGHDGSAPKFSIGNSSGNKLTWDGSKLTIVGDVNFPGRFASQDEEASEIGRHDVQAVSDANRTDWVVGHEFRVHGTGTIAVRIQGISMSPIEVTAPQVRLVRNGSVVGSAVNLANSLTGHVWTNIAANSVGDVFQVQIASGV